MPLTATDRREYTGGAREAELNGDHNDSTTTILLDDATGWPDGTDAKFTAVIDPGSATEEKILCTARVGNQLTGVTRGHDGTTAVAHSGGVAVVHNFGGEAANTLMDAVFAHLLEKAGGTLTGDITFADFGAFRPLLKDYAETVVAHGNSGSTETIDLEGGNVHTVTLDANCTFTFSNPPATGRAGSFTLILTQDATGSRSVTWPASVDWPGATAPTLSTGANDVDVLVFWTTDAGTTWRGKLVGTDFS